MDEFTLSEVCYKNGFKDGQSATIYTFIDLQGRLRAISHDYNCLKSLVEESEYFGDVVSIRKYTPDILTTGAAHKCFFWDYKEKQYKTI